jgi:hypothetical protein
MRGGRGTGKGMFVRAFGSIFGQHFTHISHSKHLTGNFNAHLEDCVVLFVDEGFWAGDKQGVRSTWYKVRIAGTRNSARSLNLRTERPSAALPTKRRVRSTSSSYEVLGTPYEALRTTH